MRWFGIGDGGAMLRLADPIGHIRDETYELVVAQLFVDLVDHVVEHGLF
jgi:hypothetical protein